ncbi:HAD-IA family hydrolase [Streptomyces canus]|uniref:HAD-IA family hydrolase n=1 Tax=Streptomyces canus TaxID=58343 RepID=UPI00216B21EA|nr:HAD-IA family hydrolase [Streptomyces canus]
MFRTQQLTPGRPQEDGRPLPHLPRCLHHGLLDPPPALRRRPAPRVHLLDRRPARAVPPRRRRHDRRAAPHRHRQLVPRRRPYGHLRTRPAGPRPGRLAVQHPRGPRGRLPRRPALLLDLDHIAFSGKIGAAKPDPAAFQHCVITLRAAPADFLFVDDREENVRAAQAVGMDGHIFRSQDDLAAVVDEWLPTR